MQVFNSTLQLRKELTARRQGGASIGLVPTMGNLHAGHLKLVEAARMQTNTVIATIFVNPLQFGPGEDLAAYPRTLEQDLAKLTTADCDYLFAPSVTDIYGNDPAQQTMIHVPGVSEAYCGQSRPGHFDGVATIVCKLFNIVAPDEAFFGLKDYQQFLVITKLVRDLAMNIKLVGVETMREADGLALSSRNHYLSSEQRKQAPLLYRQLTSTAESIEHGNRDFDALQHAACEQLQNAGLQVDYFAVCNADDLQPATPNDSNLVILAAAYLGRTRLIDNIRLQLQ
jgi:pantoate--beta-alanine ligase